MEIIATQITVTQAAINYKLHFNPYPRVRDRNGYAVYRHGYMNVDVAATGGSRSSSTVNVHDGARNMNGEPDHAVHLY